MRRAERTLIITAALALAAAGCGGEEGGVHFSKPIDEKAIGAPPRSTAPPKPRPKAAPEHKSRPFNPG